MKKTIKTISIFMEEMRWHRAIGTSYFVSRQRTIDYHRKYISRELPIDNLMIYEIDPDRYHAVDGDSPVITPDSLVVNEGNFIDANLTPESRVLFNDLVRKLFKFIELGDGIDVSIATVYLSRIIRISNLEHILTDDLQEIVRTALGNQTPWNLSDLSVLCGYPVRKGYRLDNDFQEGINRVQATLKEFLRDDYVLC